MDTEEFILKRNDLRDRMDMRRRNVFNSFNDSTHPIRDLIIPLIGRQIMNKLPWFAGTLLMGLMGRVGGKQLRKV